MARKSDKSWPEIATDSWTLGMQASSVIAMRSMRLMLGGASGEHEAKTMVEEKVNAALGFWPAMMRGGFNQSPEAMTTRALAHYSKPVRANQRRLSRKS